MDKLEIAEVSASGLSTWQLLPLLWSEWSVASLWTACSADETFLGGICAGDSGCHWDGVVHGKLLHWQGQELGTCPGLVSITPSAPLIAIIISAILFLPGWMTTWNCYRTTSPLWVSLPSPPSLHLHTLLHSYPLSYPHTVYDSSSLPPSRKSSQR